MGQVFMFTCGCGYAAEAHGGPGGIFAIELVTVACSDCKELQDVALGPWDEYPEMRSGLSRGERLKAEKEYKQIYQDRIQRQAAMYSLSAEMATAHTQPSAVWLQSGVLLSLSKR